MIKIIPFLFFLLSISLYSQDTTSLGLTDDPVLTIEEARFLMQHMSTDQLDGVDLTNKKVLFVTDSQGSTLLSKSDYFKKIKLDPETNQLRGTWVLQLTEKEKKYAGHYDLFITFWCKTVLNKKKMLKKAVKMEQMTLSNETQTN